ncbi:FAD/NAD(P)-binding domain-containing protein, partial [Ascodesmis nigricans]
DRERVIILGSGWAGYSLARRLDKSLYQPIIVTPRTYFVFTPLLAGTATGTLEFRTAMESSHNIPGVRAVRGWACNVDISAKTVEVEARVEKHVPTQDAGLETSPNKPVAISRFSRGYNPESESVTPATGNPTRLFNMSYDKLVIAVGCFSQTFNTPGVRENAFFLKDTTDARRIRRRVMDCIEEAALPTTTDERRRQLLHFAVVGGGPTGIEFSAELHDFISEDIYRLAPYLKKYVRITVYDVAPKILSMFDAKLQQYASKHFEREGIVIKTRHHVERVEPDALITKEEGRVPAGLVVWSTGLAPNPFISKGLKGSGISTIERRGQVEVDNHLRALVVDKHGSLVSQDSVFALGDCAAVKGTQLPATAQVASQAAKWLAKSLNAAGKAQEMEREFKFKSMGIMAYLGGWRAITQMESADITGRLAWLIWRGAYLTKSLSWRNKILIPTYWFVNWLLGRDINRF